jgi:hypothetical protein
MEGRYLICKGFNITKKPLHIIHPSFQGYFADFCYIPAFDNPQNRVILESYHYRFR